MGLIAAIICILFTSIPVLCLVLTRKNKVRNNEVFDQFEVYQKIQTMYYILTIANCAVNGIGELVLSLVDINVMLIGCLKLVMFVPHSLLSFIVLYMVICGVSYTVYANDDRGGKRFRKISTIIVVSFLVLELVFGLLLQLFNKNKFVYQYAFIFDVLICVSSCFILAWHRTQKKIVANLFAQLTFGISCQIVVCLIEIVQAWAYQSTL